MKKRKQKRKNPNAVALGARSWKGLNAEQRSERARQTREKQLAGLSDEERSAAMRDLINRRWSSRRSA